MTAPYAELAHRQQWESSLMPGSPTSRRLPSRVPGTSRHLERLHKINTVAEMINDDPRLAPAGWVSMP